MKITFVTVSKYKKREVKSFFEKSGIELQVLDRSIKEILDIDLEVIVRDKVIKAYKEIGLPCAVEHGGLFIDALNGLPGGLSKVVWDTVGDKICKFIQKGENRSAVARSLIGYCDGKDIIVFKGETKGKISNSAKGSYKFQWDPIFIPDGSNKTYAELGFPGKKKYSQALIAWRELIQYLKVDA